MTTHTDYDYRLALHDDIMQYITDNGIDLCAAVAEDRDEIEQSLNDALWIDDSVTGNASGSYTCNSWQAEEYLSHNLDLLQDACCDFGSDLAAQIANGAESCDVIIRCYLLPSVIADLLDEAEGGDPSLT